MKTHQHKDKIGNVFGKPHPVGAKHEKESTQRAHDRTIEEEKKNAK
jgi:hypothetical protein